MPDQSHRNREVPDVDLQLLLRPGDRRRRRPHVLLGQAALRQPAGRAVQVLLRPGEPDRCTRAYSRKGPSLKVGRRRFGYITSLYRLQASMSFIGEAVNERVDERPPLHPLP